jgi:hypothetical protein
VSEQFAEGYASRSGTTVEALRALGREPCPCDCGEDGCEGWQMAHVKELERAEAQGILSPREKADLLWVRAHRE